MCSSVYGVFNCLCVFVIEWTFCCRVILSVLLVVKLFHLGVSGAGMNILYSSFLSVQVIILFCLKFGLVSMYVCITSFICFCMVWGDLDNGLFLCALCSWGMVSFDIVQRLLYSILSIFDCSFFLFFVFISLLFVMWSIVSEQMFCKHWSWFWMIVNWVLLIIIFHIVWNRRCHVSF